MYAPVVVLLSAPVVCSRQPASLSTTDASGVQTQNNTVLEVDRHAGFMSVLCAMQLWVSSISGPSYIEVPKLRMGSVTF
jgi:hypothetical protein